MRKGVCNCRHFNVWAVSHAIWGDIYRTLSNTMYGKNNFNFEKCAFFLVKVVNRSTYIRYENLL